MQCAMTSFDNLSFITNNVKGIQSLKKIKTDRIF